MLLKVLDIIECPKCKQASRLWKLQGEVTDTRITNGAVTCPNGHTWNVTEEILRLDQAEANEEMQFLDHPRTGFPKDVEEQERLEFLDAFQKVISDLETSNDDITKIRGDPVLFFKYMSSMDGNFVVVHPEEGVLRQLQEIAARKRMYDKMSFVRSKDVELLGDIRSIGLFDQKQEDSISLVLSKDEKGEVIWSGSNVNFLIIKS